MEFVLDCGCVSFMASDMTSKIIKRCKTHSKKENNK